MTALLRRAGLLTGALLFLHSSSPLPAQSFDTRLYQDMRWRMIGPHRGGRTKAAAGMPDQPNVFYIGVVNGGVWKTTDYGRTWKPIFDDQPTGSIGAIAVAPSNPDIIYVGSGEGLQRPDLSTGDGIYKSTDAGKTWTHLGLRDGQQIPQIIVDPRNPDRLFVAVLGHPYGPNEERGVFRSTDGGRDVSEGAVQGREHRRDRRRRSIRRIRTRVYAVLWEARQGPWENGACRARAAGCSSRPTAATPGGRSRSGLPTFDGGAGPHRHRRRAERSAAAVRDRGCCAARAASTAPTTRAKAGSASATTIARVVARLRLRRGQGRSEEPGHRLHAAASSRGSRPTAARRSRAFRGAPGGDDYHRIWINPDNPKIILLASRPGRDHHRERRRDVELVVQPADRAVLPRHHRQRVSLSRLRRAAGERLGVRPEPRRRRPDHVPRLAPGRRRGVRLRRARSARSRHHLRRQGHALRPAHRPGRRTSRRSRSAPATTDVCAPRRSCFRPSIRACSTSRPTSLLKTTNGGQSWKQISPDLTRRDSDRARRTSACTRHAETARARHPRRHLHHRAVVPEGEHDLGRHRRRLDSRHARTAAQTWSNVTPPELDSRGARSRSWTRRTSTRTPPTPRSTRSGSTTCGRTSTARTTAARRGQQIVERHRPTAAPSTSCARTRSGEGCSSPAASGPSTSRSTTATTGSRCA